MVRRNIETKIIKPLFFNETKGLTDDSLVFDRNHKCHYLKEQSDYYI